MPLVGSVRHVEKHEFPCTYRLPLSKLRAAKRALGAATVTEAIERALDLVVFQRELVDGTRAMLGIEITAPDPER